MHGLEDGNDVAPAAVDMTGLFQSRGPLTKRGGGDDFQVILKPVSESALEDDGKSKVSASSSESSMDNVSSLFQPKC